MRYLATLILASFLAYLLSGCTQVDTLPCQSLDDDSMKLCYLDSCYIVESDSIRSQYPQCKHN